MEIPNTSLEKEVANNGNEETSARMNEKQRNSLHPCAKDIEILKYFKTGSQYRLIKAELKISDARLPAAGQRRKSNEKII